MALETLKGVDEINGVKITDANNYLDNNGDFSNEPIVVDHMDNLISFKIQQGPIKEVGVNGCQVTDMIAVSLHIIEKLNQKFPCKENEDTISFLQAALTSQELRTKNREARQVEGTSQL